MLDSITTSIQDVLETAEVVVAFVSAVVGFLSGWFGKKRKVAKKR